MGYIFGGIFCCRRQERHSLEPLKVLVQRCYLIAMIVGKYGHRDVGLSISGIAFVAVFVVGQFSAFPTL